MTRPGQPAFGLTNGMSSPHSAGHLTAYSPNGTFSTARWTLNVNTSLPLEVWVPSPDMHERAAVNELGAGQKRGGIRFALVEAEPALASAVNRRAGARRTGR
jgi:hypothetical protein